MLSWKQRILEYRVLYLSFVQQRKKIISEDATSIAKGINGCVVMQSALLDEVRIKSL